MGESDQKALNALAKGAGVTAIALLISKVFTYLFKLILARFLGPSAYGQFSLAVMVMGIATTLSLMSLTSSIKKYVPEYRERSRFDKVKGTVLSSLYITIPLSILAGLTMFFGAEFIAVNIFETREIIPLIKIMSIGPLFSNIKAVLYDTTKAYNIIIYDAAILKVFQSFIKVAITAALIFLGFNIIGAALGAVTSTVLVAVIGIYVLEKRIGPILTSNVKPNYQAAKILRFSYPLLLSGMIGTVMSWADTGLLGYYMADFEVGLYNAALSTAMLILLPHKAIGSLAVTSFSELLERDEERIESSIQTATYWIFSIVFPSFLILLLFSDKIMRILWGSQYVQASLVVSILAVGYLVAAMAGRVGSFLESKGYTKYLLYNNIVAVTLNLGINVLLIPIYGIIGAAIATAVSTIIGNLLMVFEAWQKENIITIPYRKITKVLFIGLAPLIIIIGIDKLLFTTTPYWFLVPAAAIYGCAYIFTFLKVLGLEKAEKELIRRLGEIVDRKQEANKLIEIIERYF